jgi:energy-coupling factor transporter ATP-binding protein EcfA2
VIAAHGIELRAGSRLLLDDTSFRIAPGDRVGLVGRNGAGKTTLTKVLAGQGQPAAGSVTASGEVGYLPQDPRTGDLHVLARDRILSAREGIFVEPGSAASVAGLLQAAQAGVVPAGATIVCTVTGHGLKDPQWALRNADGSEVTPTRVPVDAFTAAQALGLQD